MRKAKLLVVLLGCADLFGAYGLNNGGLEIDPMPKQAREKDDGKDGRSLADMMTPGDRVSAIDRSSAICSADSLSEQGEIERTVINYYYAIESTEHITTSDSTGRYIVRMLEDKLFRAIRPAILWCYFDEAQETRRNLLHDTPVGFGGDHFRRLTLEEAQRRLSIVSVSTSPQDKATTLNCNFSTNGSENCVVMHGMVTIMHHATSNVSLVVASIYDSTQKAMDYSENFILLTAEENVANITNIEWLGETEEDATIGRSNRNRGFGFAQANTEVLVQDEDENNYFVILLLLLLLLLIAFALFVTKKRTKQNMKKRELFHVTQSFDDVNLQIGNLSTNDSFPPATDFDARAEKSFENQSTAEISLEKDDDYSSDRRCYLVTPSRSALGTKHSLIDVHNCSSARCPVCTYQPRDVEFYSKSEDFGALRFGESEV